MAKYRPPIWHRTSLRFGNRGFTLIELMIAVALVAILARIALPAYFNSMRKARRADAVNHMAQMVQSQERWRANNTTYTNDFGTSMLNVLTTASSATSGLASVASAYYSTSRS